MISLIQVPILSDLQGPLKNFQVTLYDSNNSNNSNNSSGFILEDVFPFTTVTDLKRMIWLLKQGEPQWEPKRVFIGIQHSDPTKGIRPIEFSWPSKVSELYLPNPIDQINQFSQIRPNPAIVDESGTRLPVHPTMTGTVIVEDVFAYELENGIPLRVVVIPLMALQPKSTDEITPHILFGFYQMYFPWITEPGNVYDGANITMTPALSESLVASTVYTSDKTGRISTVQQSLTENAANAMSMTLSSAVRLRWVLPKPSVRPDSLERVFYGLETSETVPFIRFFPASKQQTPLLKLGLHPNGKPFLSDETILTHYLNQPRPSIPTAVIMAKIPLLGLGPSQVFTLIMFEDGTCDITLDVPQRGTSFSSTIIKHAETRLTAIIDVLGFSSTDIPELRDIHATYKWIHPNPQSIPKTQTQIKKRVAALTPFFVTPPPVGDLLIQWKAVSNFEIETEYFSFITQSMLSGKSQDEIIRACTETFRMSQSEAAVIFDNWIERHGESVSVAGNFAVMKHSSGLFISIHGSHPEYMVEIQGVETSQRELQRVISVVSVLLGDNIVNVAEPVRIVQELTADVAITDALVAEAVDSETGGEGEGEGEEDDENTRAMMSLMMGLQYTEDDDEDSGDKGPTLLVNALPPAPISTALAAPALPIPPNINAVVSSVENDCLSNPWQSGEPAMKISPDYYLAKLRKEDSVMFDFRVQKTQLTTSYSKSCQRSDGRQPNIMTLAEYARVRRCYKDKVRFVDLPPRSPADLPFDPSWTPDKIVSDDYYFKDPTPGPTYGWPMWTVYNYENKTRPGEFLYLMCAELWCERDNLPILPADYARNSPPSCPFCKGKIIEDMKSPAWGESVIKRKDKSSVSAHRFIGEMQQNEHPSGWKLPCCDKSTRFLKKFLDKAFTKTLTFKPEQSRTLLDIEDGKDIADLALVPPTALDQDEKEGFSKTTDYFHILSSMQTQYILASDKVLDAGKIGLLTPDIDAFFGQQSARGVGQSGIRTIFNKNAVLFVRVGVDVTLRLPGLNLFAGIAPFLKLQSAEEVKDFFLTRKMVRAFESANYGTLVQEFAAMATVTEEELTPSLQKFAGDYGYQLQSNRAHVMRLYKAWTTFLQCLGDVRRPKQMRWIEHLMAQPGVITDKGMLFVVIEKEKDKDTIHVACPSFGIPTSSLFGEVPVAILWHDIQNDSWTPIVLYNGTPSAIMFFGERSPQIATFPSIRRWLSEWRSSSLGCGRPAPPPHVWTPDRDTTDLPRLTQLVKQGFVAALVRDRSNRLAGVLARSESNSFFVPCLDDGLLADDIPRVFESDSIPQLPLAAYLRFYESVAKKYKGLKPVTLLSKDTTMIVGFMTAVGTIIPVEPSQYSGAMPIHQVNMFPWERDSLILRVDTQKQEKPVGASIDEQVAEAFQYVRLSMSRWLIRDGRGVALRANLTRLINPASQLPLFERRKRMDILLEPFVREWISVAPVSERFLPLLRKDCLKIEREESCVDGCTWTSSASASASAPFGRCLIHVPQGQGTGTDIVRIFTARLSDELLRFSASKREILNNTVPEIRTPSGAIQNKNELFISTKPNESSSTILSRLGFTGESAPAFPEEMLRFEGAEEEDVDEEREREREGVAADKNLPESWTELGFTIPTQSGQIDADSFKRLVFVEGTGRSIQEWEAKINAKAKTTARRQTDITFQWSSNDFYYVSMLAYSDIVFVDSDLQITRWIRCPIKTTPVYYMIFWNDLLVTKGPKKYRFPMIELPSDLIRAIESSTIQPITQAEAEEEEMVEEAETEEVGSNSDNVLM